MLTAPKPKQKNEVPNPDIQISPNPPPPNASGIFSDHEAALHSPSHLKQKKFGYTLEPLRCALHPKTQAPALDPINL